MFNTLLRKKKQPAETYDSVIYGLKRLYKQKLVPLEEAYKFNEFHSAKLEDADFDAAPMVVLVGQYSTGKTTFIRYILGQDYPGIHIGVEPTTDRFIAVAHTDTPGSPPQVIPGHALISDQARQYTHLQKFGGGFLNRFQASLLENELLENVTFIDTPGILSGDKQRDSYDIFAVFEWFFERADRIIMMFDAHKLDISDEMHFVMKRMRHHEDKIRILLNKSDRVNEQQLMRVYGALLWSLGKVLNTPEVARVYVGSFWHEPRLFDHNRKLFELEEADLFHDLLSLQRSAAARKLNDLIKRARLAKCHAYIISELKEAIPMIGKERKQRELIANLGQIFAKVSRERGIPESDMPNLETMKKRLVDYDFGNFNSLQSKLIKTADELLSRDVAQLMLLLPSEEAEIDIASVRKSMENSNSTNTLESAKENQVFNIGAFEGFDAGRDDHEWIVNQFRNPHEMAFRQLNVDGKVPGSAAKSYMVKSKLPNPVLGRIWKLADIDRDGHLDQDEWALANYLIQLRVEGHELPSMLPSHLVPPAKRDKIFL